jgi:hypothetical protein
VNSQIAGVVKTTMAQSDSERQFLRACLAALLRRCSGTVVIEETDIDLAYSSANEFTWRRDRALKVVRLSVPAGESQ